MLFLSIGAIGYLTLAAIKLHLSFMNLTQGTLLFKIKTLLIKFETPLLKFVFVTLFYRFLNENLLSSLVSLAVEFNTWYFEKRNLNINTERLSFFFIVLSFIWVFAKITLLSILIKITTKPMAYFHDGLMLKNRFWVLIYYVHFIVFRVFMALLIFASAFIGSKIMIICLLVLQLSSFLLHLRFRLYQDTLIVV